MKDEVKLEFDFLKLAFFALFTIICGLLTYIFNKDLSFIKFVVSFAALIGVTIVNYKILKRIIEIYKG